MIASTDLENILPFIREGISRFRPVATESPSIARPGIAVMYCELFDRIRKVNEDFLDMGSRNRSVFEQIRLVFADWLGLATEIYDLDPWPNGSDEIRQKLLNCIETAEDILADFARGEEGMKQLAEFFRNEEDA